MKRPGLTIVEVCILVAVVAMVLAVVFIVIDPASKHAAQRNTQRWTDVTLLMEGVQTAFTQTQGELTGDLEGIDSDAATVQVIVNGSAEVACATSCATEQLVKTACTVDFSPLANNGLIAAVPTDPSVSGNGSNYYVNYDDGVFTIGACSPEQEKNGATPNVRLSR